MNKVRNLCILILHILFLFSNCNRKQTPPTTNTIVIDASGDIGDDYILKKGNGTKIIPLETNDKSILSSVRKVIFHNNKFYIRDIYGKAIYIFDENGALVDKLDRQGKGPGEYIEITDFAIADNGLFILDYYYEILKYNIKNLNYENSAFNNNESNVISKFYIGNDHIYSYNASSRNIGDLLIDIYGLGGDIKAKKSMLEKKIGDGGKTKDSKEDFHKIMGDSGVLFNNSNENVIFLFFDNEVKSMYELDFGKYSLPTHVFDSHDKIREYRRDNKLRWIYNYYQTNNLLCVELWDQDRPNEISRLCHLVYNTNKKTVKIYKSLHVEDLNQDIRLFGNYPKGFIGIISSEEIIERLGKIEESYKKGKTLSPEDENFKYMFTENSNPALVLFNFENQ